MPISENVNGVLRTHSAEYENVGGVTVEKNSVVVNDGGVMREIYSASVGAATVEGITPLVVAEDHIVIVESSTFTLSAPKGARIIIGSGASNGWLHNSKGQNVTGNLYTFYGGLGGFVASYTLEKSIHNAQCIATLGSAITVKEKTNEMTDDAVAAMLEPSTLKIGDTTYDSGTERQVIESKWGPIGGNGGYGCKIFSLQSDSSHRMHSGKPGTGAGGGSGAIYGAPADGNDCYYSGGKGGNNGGYGNFGGNGGGSKHTSSVYLELIPATNGACGQAGKSPGLDCPGGGGGYSAGGGFYNGEGGAGIIVIEW